MIPEGRAERERWVLDHPEAWVSPRMVAVKFDGVTVRVACDVFAVNDDSGPLRLPLAPIAAQTIAERHAMALITTKISDAIWHSAEVRLAPEPMTPERGYPYDASMMSLDRFRIHDSWIEDKRTGRDGLIAGHKKDVVLSERLAQQRGKVAIYGWHRTDGRPIQPLSLIHEETYVDYSHGVRFMDPWIEIDGAHMTIDDALSSPTLARRVNYGGVIRTRYPVLHPELCDPFETAPFIKAQHYTPASRTAIDLVVIHDMESPEKPGTARAVARWFAGPSAPQASAHYCVDAAETIQCVADHDVAWHAPGANHNGIGIEHAGYAKQSPSDWDDEYSHKMLDRSAALTAHLCALYSIPIQFVDAAGLLRGERGITTHAAVSKAFHKSDHVDPGPNFPMQSYIARVIERSGCGQT